VDSVRSCASSPCPSACTAGPTLTAGSGCTVERRPSTRPTTRRNTAGDAPFSDTLHSTLPSTLYTTPTKASVYSRIFFWGGGRGIPPNVHFRQTAAKWCSKSFLVGTGNYKYSRNFLIMDNKHRKIFVIQQLKGCKFVPKMRQDRIRLASASSRWGSLYALPDPCSPGELYTD